MDQLLGIVVPALPVRDAGHPRSRPALPGSRPRRDRDQRPETNVDDVRAYAQRYQLGYTIAADLSGHIYRMYRPPGLPTQVFVGPEGVIRSIVLAPMREVDAIAQIEAILPNASASSQPSASASPPSRRRPDRQLGSKR